MSECTVHSCCILLLRLVCVSTPATLTSNPHPGDPLTKAWLERAAHPVFGLPLLVRHSWATCTPILDQAGCARVRWECEEDPSQDASQQTLSFKRKAAAPATTRHSFFRVRRLHRATASDGFTLAAEDPELY